MSEVINIQNDELYTAYQPLYHLEDHALFSFESLLRSKKDIPPTILFDSSFYNQNKMSCVFLSPMRG